jgi:hypothetical protein
MFSRVIAERLSSGRLAWLVAAGAVALLVTLPPSVSAQSADDRPTDATPSLAKSGRPIATPSISARRRDLLNARDGLDDAANSAPVEPFIAKTVNAILCVAGCDSNNGKVVFQGPSAPLPILAAIDLQMEPVRTVSTDNIRDTVTPAATASAGTIVCLAGCYDGERRTFAATGPAGSIHDANGRAFAAAPGQAKVRVASLVPRTDAPVSTDLKPNPRSRALALKRGFTAHASRKSSRRNALIKSPVRAASEPTVAVAAAAPVATPPAAVSNFTTTTTPAAPQDATAKPVKKAIAPRNAASVSNDWFNRINRDRASAQSRTDQ